MRTHRIQNSPALLVSLSLVILAALFLCPETSTLEAADGSAPIIQKIEVVGSRRIDQGTILRRISSRVGTPLSREAIREDIRTIYGMGGYFDNVQVESEPVSGGIALIFRVDEKPVISQITIEGNKELEEGKIQDVLEARIGSPYDLRRIKGDEENVKRLYRAHGFHFARLERRVTDDANGNKQLVYKIDEGKKVIIGEIILQGSSALKAGAIKKKAMETKEHWLMSFLTSAGVYKGEILDIDLERIKDYYYRHGYLEVKIGEPQISFDKPEKRPKDRLYEFFKGWGWGKNKIAVIIPISEGEQYRIHRMGFRANEAIDGDKLRSALASKEGDVFSSEAIRKDMANIAHLYGEIGYAFATASPLTDLNRESRTVDLTWDIDEGQRVYIGEINIAGNTRTRDNVIRREVRFNEGDQYNIAQIDRSKVRIRNTGFFEDVQFSTERRPGEQVVDLNIGVKEQQTGSLSFGVGASSTQGLVGSFDVRQKNFMGTGREFNVAALLGGEDSSFNFRFLEPWLFDREVSLGASIFKTYSDYDSFEEDTVGGSIIFGRALDEYSRGTLTFDYEEIDFSNVDENFELGTADTQSVFGITLGWRRNTVDNILEPTKGYLTRASVKFASLLADADFNKYFLSHRFFLQGPGKLVLSLNGEAGYADVENGNDIPISELFFLGGIESVRGYQYRSLGPRNFFGSLIGGRKMLILNTELYFPIAPSAGLKGFLFFDIGKVYDPVILTKQEVDLEETILPNRTDGDVWKKSYGIGFAWRSPAGPIKIIWANPIDDEDFDELETIQFSLGTTF